LTFEPATLSMFLNVNSRLIFLTLPILPSHVSSPRLRITFQLDMARYSFILYCIVLYCTVWHYIAQQFLTYLILKQHAQLSQRDSAAVCVTVLAKMSDWNWETIFYAHNRPIFNHRGIIGLKICQIR